MAYTALLYPRTFSTDLITLTCKMPGQETCVVNTMGMRPRLCSGPWSMQPIDILTTVEFCPWRSTRSAWPDSDFPLCCPLQGCRMACNGFLVLQNKTFRSVQKVRGYNSHGHYCYVDSLHTLLHWHTFVVKHTATRL